MLITKRRIIYWIIHCLLALTYIAFSVKGEQKSNSYFIEFVKNYSHYIVFIHSFIFSLVSKIINYKYFILLESILVILILFEVLN